MTSYKKVRKRKCPKKGKNKWCPRLRRCVKPCPKCLEPIIVGEDYLCGPRRCRTWETCKKRFTCHGSIAGSSYFYEPRLNDPCGERVFY